MNIFHFQLNISDVHIRYEDELTVPGSIFAMGIGIDSLAAQSCDNQWCPGLGKPDLSHSFKLVQLNNLSVYWDALSRENLWNNLSNAELTVSDIFSRDQGFLVIIFYLFFTRAKNRIFRIQSPFMVRIE